MDLITHLVWVNYGTMIVFLVRMEGMDFYHIGVFHVVDLDHFIIDNPKLQIIVWHNY